MRSAEGFSLSAEKQAKKPECPPTRSANEAPTYRGIRITRAVGTREAGSTLEEKDFLPYWTDSCAERSKNWLSLTETGCAGSDLNSLSDLQSTTIQGSWFFTRLVSHLGKNLQETLFPSFTFSAVEFMDSENTLVRCHKIKIFPAKESMPRMRQYLGLSRFWFNKTIAYLKQKGTKANLYEVRKILQQDIKNAWELDGPQRVREHAIADACAAVRIAKDKSNTHGYQEVHFRTRKDIKQSFGFDRKSMHANFVFSKNTDRVFFNKSEEGKADAEGCRIVHEGSSWYIILPHKIAIKVPENQRLPIVAIDPGVRNFVSYYAPECSGVIGAGAFRTIYKLCITLDKLQGKISKALCRQKKRMKKAAERIRVKIKNLIADMHKKTAHFLVTRFDTIVLPPYQTSKMVTKLRSKTARSMLTLAPYRFSQTLKSTAEKYSAVVIHPSEAYTSRTCSYCGELHPKNSKMEFNCSCGAAVPRDGNGSRGILLRLLGASPFNSQELEHLLNVSNS